MGLTSFTVTKFKDTYVVKNEGESSLSAVLEVQSEGCTTFEVINPDINIPIGGETKVSPLYDGYFKLILTDDVSGETADIYMLHYVDILKVIVGDIHYILCDCAPESNCTDCTYEEGCIKQLSTMLKIVSYQQLTHPQHAAFLETVFEPLKCSVKELSIKLVTDEQINGEGDYVELLKKILSFYYLAFYHSEVKQTSNEELDYINEKFNYDVISACIEDQLLIDVQTKIDAMGTFTVISGAYVNQPPVVGDNTIERDNRVTTPLTLEMFTSQTTPPYTDPENDPVDALRVDSIDGNNQGVYEYDNSPITVGLIIPADHITSGRLVHIGADTDAVVNDSFGFSLRDTGSMTWVS